MLTLNVCKTTFCLIVFLGVSQAAFAGDYGQARVDSMRELYTGSDVKTPEGLKAYTGIEAVGAITGEWRKKAYVLNYEQLAVNYGDNVEFQLRREQIVLCPQTAEFLYGELAPATTRYVKGSRPALETVVSQVTTACRNDQDKALALMRFCRDLKKKDTVKPGNGFEFGGTEELLIEKGEDLCETLGRLFVGLCEIAGIPARIVMHDIGGHITAEACIDGNWGYIDPRFGLYFLKANGNLASVWELWKNPSLLRKQSRKVQAEVAGEKSWEQRVRNCEQRYFNLKEINGFEYYSLADAPRYNYATIAWEEAKRAGLWKVHEVYVALIDKVFGQPVHIEDYFWQEQKLEKVPVNYRHDGFSMWHDIRPPVTEEKILNDFSELKGIGLDTIIWGTGPGSTQCYDTKVGTAFGDGVTDEQWEEFFRTGDRYVYEDTRGMIEKGIKLYEIVTKEAHKHGMKLYGRLEMNHEYGPDTDDPCHPNYWMWLGFIGEFNKSHPEYRIAAEKQHFGGTNLDFKHKEVRDYKLAILREVAERGADGVELDFAVYPPFFEDPEPEIMTGFVRDVRAMLNEVAQAQGRERMALNVSVVAQNAEKYHGLDWRTWMTEGLVDAVVPTHVQYSSYGPPRAEFDVKVGDYVRTSKQSNSKTYGRLFQSLCIFAADPSPKHKGTNKRYYSKDKTAANYRAQALMYLRTGVDGIQFAMGDNHLEDHLQECIVEVGDPAKIEFADKEYIVDPFPNTPEVVPAKAAGAGEYRSSRTVRMRVADNITKAKAKGYNVDVELVFNVRQLGPGERLEVFINGNGPIVFSGDSAEEKEREEPVGNPTYEDLTTPGWWKRGEHRVAVDPDWLWMGENLVRFNYCGSKPQERKKLQYLWPELALKYHRNDNNAH